ncbi:MAG: hypothetical protein CBHOC_2174 [uncultured Caballeronia sp.]|nr:MAG: hypothetical protein CBHOC_2174 [uncultured Caballeronia sp.]
MMQGPSDQRSRIIAFPLSAVTRRVSGSCAVHEGRASLGYPTGEASNANAMFVLGRIGAIVCHAPRPRCETAILPAMAAHPADGLWLAIARLNDSSQRARPDEAMLLQHKRQTVARLSRLLPHPLPLAVSGEAQMSF